MTKQLVIFGTAVMTTLLALLVLWQFRIVVIYLLISLTVAAALRPWINRLAGRGFVARVTWILLYLGGLAGFGFLLFLIGRTAISEIQQLFQVVSVRDRWMLPLWLEGSSFQEAFVALLPPPSTLFEAFTGDEGQFVLPAILGVTQGIAGVVSATFVILFLSIYWSTSQFHFERLWLSLLPSEQRKYARDSWRAIERHVGAYIRNEIVQSLLAGLLLGLGYWLLGSPYPTLLAVVGALAWLIPVVGAALAVVLPLLLGLLTSVQLSLFTAVFTLVVLISLQVWVEPRLFRRRWDNPILTLIILLAMADAFGLLGIVVAPPLSAVCQILWNLLVSNRLASGSVERISDLKERQARLQTAIAEMDDVPLPLVLSSMQRLADLIEKAEPILQAAAPAENSDLSHGPNPLPGEIGSSTSTKS